MQQNGRWVSEGLTRTLLNGTPASVISDGAGRLRLRSSCDMVEEESVEYESFWDLLEDWGGGWMWENVTEDTKNQDYDWIEKAMREGTLVWCADGSYKRETDPDVCGVG